MTRLHWRPGLSERLLLQAALGEGTAAATAFARWDLANDWDGPIDAGAFRMLPLVFANLSQVGIRHPRMPRLAGIYRHSWCEAQRHLRRGIMVVGLLAEHGIDVMLSKGLLLATAYYRSPAERPMSDIDILVPRGQALAALELLRGAGWSAGATADARWRSRGPDMMRLAIGQGLDHPEMGEVDLHWDILHEFAPRDVGARWWDAAEPMRLGDIALRQPSPTHLLFHVIAHGLRPNPLSPLRWVADAATILRTRGETIDWDEISWLARRLRLDRRLHFGFELLGEIVPFERPRSQAPAPIASLVERIEDRCSQARVDAPESRRARRAQRLAYLLRLGTGPEKWHIPRIAAQSIGRRLGAGTAAR